MGMILQRLVLTQFLFFPGRPCARVSEMAASRVARPHVPHATPGLLGPIARHGDPAPSPQHARMHEPIATMLNPEIRAPEGREKTLQYTTCNLNTETAPPGTLVWLRTLLVCNLLPWKILRRLNGSSCPPPPSAASAAVWPHQQPDKGCYGRRPVPAPSGAYSPHTPALFPRPDPTPHA